MLSIMTIIGCMNGVESAPDHGPLEFDSGWTDTADTGGEDDTGTMGPVIDVESATCEGSGDYDFAFGLFVNDGDKITVTGHFSAGYMWWREDNGSPLAEEWDEVSTWEVDGGQVHQLCHWFEDDGAAFYQIDQFVLTVVRAS